MKKLLVFLMVAGLVIAGSGQASASLLFDRGLPTTNLNTGNASQSNVLWGDTEPSMPSLTNEYWLPGDTVVLTNPGTYHIDTVRVWTTSNPIGLSLLAGSDVSNAGTFSSYTSTPVTYSNAAGYLGSTGSLQLYQLDFAINEDITSGTYYFFLDGPWVTRGSGYVSPYIHASNAALSGSTQQGADDVFWYLHIDTGVVVGPESWDSATGAGTISGVGSWDGLFPGWDKTTDANVQVFGTQVPEPATMLLLGLGLVGLAGIRRKFRS